MAHRITTRTPISDATAGEDRHAVDGTPADCARIALKQIDPDVDWLVAGINPGANLGSDVYNSGTVAAAREAAILGCPSIAISQYIAKDHEIDWRITGRHAKGILTTIMAQQLETSHFWNINLPHPLDDRSAMDFAFCSLDTSPHKYEFITQGSDYIYQGSIHERPRRPGTDVAVCFDEGKISVTQIPLGTI